MWFTTYLPRKPVAPKTVLVIPLRSVGVAGGRVSRQSQTPDRKKIARCRARARADRGFGSHAARVGRAMEVESRT